MTTIASQVTSLTSVYSTVYSDADKRKHQSSASLAFVWGIHRDRRIPRTKGQLRGKNVSIWWRHHVWSMFSLNLICHGFPVGTSSRLTVCNIIPYRVVQPDNSISNRRIYQSSVVFVPTKQQGKMSFCWFWKLLYNSPSPPTDYVILHFQSSSYSIKQLYNSLLLIGQRLSWLLVISSHQPNKCLLNRLFRRR